MSRVSPWLQDKAAPDVKAMTEDELHALWAANRNSLIAVVAADEMMRRYQLTKETKK